MHDRFEKELAANNEKQPFSPSGPSFTLKLICIL